MQRAAVEVQRLTKVFGGVRVVDDVSFVVAAGQLLTLLGPSGSGKTTTLRMIAGFEDPTDGEIRVGDEVLNDTPAHRRNIGVVFQQYALFPHLTVFHNIAYPLQVRRYEKAEVRRRVEWAIELVRLRGFESRYPRQLSGGQQQRVALARSIVFEPRVLLMDEPLGALDKRLRETMQVEIRQLQQRLGITTVSVTHDQVEALVMSDVIAVMDGGRLQQIGPPSEVYQRPANQFVADFIGESNLLSGTALPSAEGEAGVLVTDRGLRVRVDQPIDPAGARKCHAVVRPESIRMGPGAAEAANRFHGSVIDVLYVGDIRKYRIRLDSGDEVTAKSLVSRSDRKWAAGDDTAVGWEAADCLVLDR